MLGLCDDVYTTDTVNAGGIDTSSVAHVPQVYILTEDIRRNHAKL